ncbi:Ig-like domain-containing protein [Algivirga pacifica]|uniref:Dystroglycan-type cadherin-like domain-containing protein n=1 Tax=Algivirga pacifica TaxID=1162670 RepID=A0ABP9DKU6_9BACT
MRRIRLLELFSGVLPGLVFLGALLWIGQPLTYAQDWVQKGNTLYGDETESYFSSDVALSAGGKRMVVSSSSANNDTGHVKVFQWEETNWVQLGATLLGDSTGHRFGSALDISDDGKRIVVGTPNTLSNVGKVSVYEWNIDHWIKVGNDIYGEAASDYSGSAISISGDGNVIAIGANSNDGNGVNSGQVRVYEWKSSNWTKRGADIDGEVAGDLFGYTVSLSHDGNRLLATARDNDDGAENVGQARVFEWNGTAWLQLGGDLNGIATTEMLGYASDISADGTTIALGTFNANLVKCFKWNGSTWTLKGNISRTGGFGSNLSLSNSGDKLLVGAYNSSYNGSQSGSAYVYAWDGSNWLQEGQRIDGEAASNLMGRPLAISGDGKSIALVAQYNSTNAYRAGQVRMFVQEKPNQPPTVTAPLSKKVLVSTHPASTVLLSMLFSDADGDALTYTATSQNTGVVTTSITGEVLTLTEASLGSTTIEVTADDGKGGSVTTSFEVVVATKETLAWEQLGMDIDGQAINDYTGYSVSMSSDGSRLVIGAIYDDGIGVNSGNVRIYEWSGSNWVQLGLDIDAEAVSDNSGWTVSMSSVGNHVAIGAIYNDGNGTDAGHVRVYEWNGSSWVQLGLDIDGEAASDYSGKSISISSDGNRLAIGAYGNDGNGTNAGHIRVYEWSGSNWSQLGLDIDGEAASDESGWSVSMSSDGSRLAIGAIYNDGNGTDAGHVRIYEWNGNNWVQLGLDIDGEVSGDRFGYSVSMSSDGNRLAIGSILNDGSSANAGHVRIYEWNGSSWIQLGVDIDGESAGDESGNSVSLSSEGNRLAIGAYLNDGNGDKAGHVRIYEWNGSSWIQLGLDIDGEAADDRFGWATGMSSDGTRLAVGAYENDGNSTGAGHVRVYELGTLANKAPLGLQISNQELKSGNAITSITLSDWFVDEDGDPLTYTVNVLDTAVVLANIAGDILTINENDLGTTTLEVTANDGKGGTTMIAFEVSVVDPAAFTWKQVGQTIEGANPGDWAGKGVAISEDGKRIIVSSHGDNSVGTLTGVARVYENIDGTWTELGGGVFGEMHGDHSGDAVAISGDGSHIVVGAQLNDNANGIDAGHIRVYKWTGTTWVQVGADIDGDAVSDRLGHSVSISHDGTRIAVGAHANDANGSDAGHVKAYQWNGSSWIQMGSAILGEALGDNFGISVALNYGGSRLAVGGRYNDGAGSNAGHARIFSWNGSNWIQLGADIDGEAAGDNFGESIGLSKDGKRVIIGGLYNDGAVSNAGHARVYDWDGTTWNQVGTDIEGKAANDYSGYGTSISYDGNRIAIGGPYNDDNGNNAGNAMIYDWNGTQWVKLGNDLKGAAEDYFGQPLMVSPNGHHIIVGAYGNGVSTFNGYAKVFELSTASSNTAPTIKNEINDFSYTEGTGPHGINFINVFEDADGDTLTYTATVMDTNIATVSGGGFANASFTFVLGQAGSTEVTITAEDGKGGNVSDTFILSVNATANNSPYVGVPINDQSYTAGFGSETIVMDSTFFDPDGDALTYAVSSNNTAVVTASVSGINLVLNEVGAGSATVTVTANDGKGGVISDSFVVTVTAVSNNAPIIVNPIADKTLTEGFASDLTNLAAVFNDADGDVLNYTAVSNNEGIVTVGLSGSSLYVYEAGIGTATVTVTANDGKGGVISDSFIVTVNAAPNNAPTVINTIADQTLTEGFSTWQIDISNVFNDPDGDALSYELSVDDTFIVTANVSGNMLTLTEQGVGTTTVWVTANDGKGASDWTNFEVTVLENTSEVTVEEVINVEYTESLNNSTVEINSNRFVLELNRPDLVKSVRLGVIPMGDILEENYMPTTMNFDGGAQYAVTQDINDPFGIFYDFEIELNDGSLIYYPEDRYGFRYRIYEEGFFNFANYIGVGNKADDYRMISLPLAASVGKDIQDLLPNLMPIDEERWRMWTWSGERYDPLYENDGIWPGDAYWILSTDRPNLSSPELSAEVRPEVGVNSQGDFEPFVLELWPGWKMISTPFNMPLNWEQIIARNIEEASLDGDNLRLDELQQISTELVSWNGSRTYGNMLYPFEGAFVENRGDSWVNINIYPIQDFYNTANLRQAAESNWKVQLEVQSATKWHHTAYFGMHKLATDALDGRDARTAPLLMEHLPTARFTRPSLNGAAVIGEMITEATSGTWTFDLSSGTEEALQLRWKALDVAVGKQLYLYDHSTQRITDMQQVQTYQGSTSEATFTAFYGSQERIASMLSEAGILVGTAYPNPFREQTTFELLVPEQESGSSLQIRVMDLTGKQVKQIYQGTVPSGLLRVSWDGSQQNGGKVQKGMYLYQMLLSTEKGSRAYTGKVMVE